MSPYCITFSNFCYVHWVHIVFLAIFVAYIESMYFFFDLSCIHEVHIVFFMQYVLPKIKIESILHFFTILVIKYLN